MTILDVGAGTAGRASSLAVSPDDAIVAIDSNAGYLRNYRRSVGDRTAFLLVADAGQLPIRGSGIDMVVCTELLEHVSDYRKVLAELSRVGRQGCGYYISVPVARWEYLFRKLHPRWLASSGHKNVFTITGLTQALHGAGINLTGYAGCNSWSCLYWSCHSIAQSDFNDAGLTLNHHGIDAAFIQAERLLRRLRLWNLFNQTGDRLWPKSWVIHAVKN